MHATARRLPTAAALVALLAAAPAGALAQRVVAVSGDEAPESGGALFLGFGAPVIDAAGGVSFTARLEPSGGATEDDDLGLWSEQAGSLRLVERRGSPAVGVAGAWDVAIAPPARNDAGQVAFRASVDAPGRSGLWRGAPGALALVAFDGGPAPGLPAGTTWSGEFSEPVLNDAGQVGFRGGLDGAASGSGVFSGAPGALLLSARSGDPAPGSDASYLDFEGVRLDAGGGVAFRATLDDGGTGIYAGPAGAVQRVASGGSPAPGVPGARFASLLAPQLGASGAVAFHAGLETGTGGVSSGDDRGVWAGPPGGLALVAREGGSAPDSGGRVFASFSTPLVNAAGEVLFRGFLDSGTGLYLLDDALGLVKVAASGDLAPGTDLGAGDASFAAFSDWALSDDGRVVFEATLAGVAAGVSGSTDGSLWLRDGDGSLALLAREGDVHPLAAGDSAVVESIDFFGDSAGRGRGLADGPHVAFAVGFSDGREAVLPEPAPALPLALGALLAGALSRRRGGRKPPEASAGD